MSILETATVFVGVPGAVIGVIAGLVYLSGNRPARRYRPGRPYEFTPVWFVANPGAGSAQSRPRAIESPDGERTAGVKGGARGSW